MHPHHLITDQQSGKLRQYSRHRLFPQVLKIVEEYCESRIDWSGHSKQELAMDIYMKPFVTRLFPDFIVKLRSGINLVLEIKGLVDDREKAKFEAAKRWCSAVNNWGKMGTWEFHAAKDPDHLQKELNYLNH